MKTNSSELSQQPGPSAKAPDVSIIMSAYNESRWLPETIEAMLAQTHVDFELLVIDDASTDDTPEVLARYTDPRLRFIRHETRNGWMNNINKLARMARGRLLKLHCPDDVMQPHGMALAVNLYKRHPEVGYIISDYYFFDQEGQPIWERPVKPYDELISGPTADEIALRDGCIANTSCMYVPRDKYLAWGGLRDLTEQNPDRIPTAEEYDLMVRLQEYYPAGYLKKKLVAVRTHGAQVQANQVGQLLSVEASIAVYKNLVERMSRRDPSSAGRFKREMARKIARDHLTPTIKSALRGEWRHASRMLHEMSRGGSLLNLAPIWIRFVGVPALARRFSRLALSPTRRTANDVGN